MRRQEEADRGDARVRIRRPQAGQRFGYRRGMVGEVVIDRHAASPADDFQPPLHACEPAQAVGDPPGGNAEVSRNRDGGGRVAHVVGADQRQLEGSKRRAPTPNLEARRGSNRHEIVRVPVHAF
jgi:hypothetical protein